MKPSVAFEQHRETIRRLVADHGMSNPRLFGSALHGDDTETSDLDILVDAPADISLLDIAGLQIALEDILKIHIDLRTPEDLHPRFRSIVVDEAVSV
jgi:predicted nucleotidyltransferase